MKIIVASDSFKGSLTSRQIGGIVKEAAHKVDPRIQVQTVVITDGGEGTVDAFYSAAGKCKHCASVQGPNGNLVDAEYCILRDDTAVIEAASVVGLAQHKNNYDPLQASSYGVGQLMLDAINKGHTRLIVGLGGSCTTDGGIGIAAALGFSFLDKNDKPVEVSPKSLAQVAAIRTEAVVPTFWGAEILFACDVTNPLFGPNGAAYIFAPQKGASAEQVKELDKGLRCLAETIRRSTGMDLQSIKGTGAAGGMCSVLLAYGNAIIDSGLNTLLQMVDFENLIANADLIITGEGRLDAQSLQGKVPLAIANRGKHAGKRVIAVVGSIDPNLPSLAKQGISSVYTISSESVSLQENMDNGAQNYFDVIYGILQAID